MICYLGRAQFQFSGWFICKHINITKRACPSSRHQLPVSSLSPRCLCVCVPSAHTRLIFHFNGAFLIKKCKSRFQCKLPPLWFSPALDKGILHIGCTRVVPAAAEKLHCQLRAWLHTNLHYTFSDLTQTSVYS